MTDWGRRLVISIATASLLLTAPAGAFPQSSPHPLMPTDLVMPSAADSRPRVPEVRPPLTSEEVMMDAVADGAVWCLRGATFAVLFSAAFSVPGMLTGLGTTYGTTRAASAAMAGCGMAITWRALARTLAYLDGVLHPLTVAPETPTRPLNKNRRLIETAG